MEILGIGPLEFLLILLVAFLILGPKEIEKTTKSIGKGLNKLVKSDTWKTVRNASEKVRTLPDELMRQAGVDELKQSLDSNLVQPAKDMQKSIDTLGGESWIPDAAEPKKDAGEKPASDGGQVEPPKTEKGEAK